MTQHEYIFVSVSIIIGLAITRILNVVGDLIRYHKQTHFHWSTAIWGLSVMTFTLQLWWMGWGLHDYTDWNFSHFAVLIFASISIYGAAEMALPDPRDGHFDMLAHSQSLGRVSATSMLAYFLVGPYVNVTMFKNPLDLSLAIPLVGVMLMILVIFIPRGFKLWSVLFAAYSIAILYITV